MAFGRFKFGRKLCLEPSLHTIAKDAEGSRRRCVHHRARRCVRRASPTQAWLQHPRSRLALPFSPKTDETLVDLRAGVLLSGLLRGNGPRRGQRTRGFRLGKDSISACRVKAPPCRPLRATPVAVGERSPEYIRRFGVRNSPHT